MHKCKFLIFWVFWVSAQVNAQVYGTLTDSRDGKKYKTLKIDKFEIMAENLSFKEAGICYEMENLFCLDYGRLYDFKDVDNQFGICPLGWHIPTKAEWMYIFTKLNGSITNYPSGLTKVDVNSNKLEFTFSGYGNGERDPGYVSFFGLQENGFFASSTTSKISTRYNEWVEWSVVRFEKYEKVEGIQNSNFKFTYFLIGTSMDNNVSCRCIKDY